jgi:hypothetical protein
LVCMLLMCCNSPRPSFRKGEGKAQEVIQGTVAWVPFLSILATGFMSILATGFSRLEQTDLGFSGIVWSSHLLLRYNGLAASSALK